MTGRLHYLDTVKYCYTFGLVYK